MIIYDPVFLANSRKYGEVCHPLNHIPEVSMYGNKEYTYIQKSALEYVM